MIETSTDSLFVKLAQSTPVSRLGLSKKIRRPPALHPEALFQFNTIYIF